MPSVKLTEAQMDNLLYEFEAYEKEPRNEYMSHFFQDDTWSISVYKSGKVVFQGKDLYLFKKYLPEEEEQLYQYDFMNTIGSDEVGTGDVFGPMVIGTAFVKGKDTNNLKKLGVKDSKKLKDEDIIKIGGELIKKLKYKVWILRNDAFNNNSEKYNLNAMKAILHNKNIRDLAKEVPYDMVCLDQFCSRQKYFEYLEGREAFTDMSFETKGETKSVAVAAASIIARYFFLEEMKRLEEIYGYHLPKGSGAIADAMIEKIKNDGKEDILRHIAKLNFKNFKGDE